MIATLAVAPPPISAASILEFGTKIIKDFKGRLIPSLTLDKPASIEDALRARDWQPKVTSVLSNRLEYMVVDELNSFTWGIPGEWHRQDPAFPDAIFKSKVLSDAPGFEIKAWCPFATELTARFKGSSAGLEHGNTKVAIVIWLPEFLHHGRPMVIDVGVFPALDIARARDSHYFKPPEYVVLEPVDTKSRTCNLQQTGTVGYGFQGSPEELYAAKKVVESWGPDGLKYSTSEETQSRLRSLTDRFRYRPDTNFGKLGRIMYQPLNDFLTQQLNHVVAGRSLYAWDWILRPRNASRFIDDVEALISLDE